MEENLAYCGLACHSCAIYLATREKDEEKRHKMRVDIAQQIKERYGQECNPEDVADCDGCKTESERLLPDCKKCEIRKCATQKKIENCAHCDEYACEKLEKFFTTDPEAKTRLDATRNTL